MPAAVEMRNKGKMWKGRHKQSSGGKHYRLSMGMWCSMIKMSSKDSEAKPDELVIWTTLQPTITHIILEILRPSGIARHLEWRYLLGGPPASRVSPTVHTSIPVAITMIHLDRVVSRNNSETSSCTFVEGEWGLRTPSQREKQEMELTIRLKPALVARSELTNPSHGYVSCGWWLASRGNTRHDGLLAERWRWADITCALTPRCPHPIHGPIPRNPLPSAHNRGGPAHHLCAVLIWIDAMLATRELEGVWGHTQKFWQWIAGGGVCKHGDEERGTQHDENGKACEHGKRRSMRTPQWTTGYASMGTNGGEHKHSGVCIMVDSGAQGTVTNAV
ncbi:hypothetical protein BD779DRAFT_1481665 [Infundibulicybe gibba]|nr:hypothetical protein BD779DRAFT_1481665 [Infundibulicybe gibba]